MSPYHIATNLLFVFCFCGRGGWGLFFLILYLGKRGFHFLLFLNKDVLFFFFYDGTLIYVQKKGGYKNDVISTTICC